MPSNPKRPDANNPAPRDETPVEFSERVQYQMDQDSWQGVDTVGARYPAPAKIVEYEGDDHANVIFKRRSGT